MYLIFIISLCLATEDALETGFEIHILYNYYISYLFFRSLPQTCGLIWQSFTCSQFCILTIQDDFKPRFFRILEYWAQLKNFPAPYGISCANSCIWSQLTIWLLVGPRRPHSHVWLLVQALSGLLLLYSLSYSNRLTDFFFYMIKEHTVLFIFYLWLYGPHFLHLCLP